MWHSGVPFVPTMFRALLMREVQLIYIENPTMLNLTLVLLIELCNATHVVVLNLVWPMALPLHPLTIMQSANSYEKEHARFNGVGCSKFPCAINLYDSPQKDRDNIS